MKRKFKSKNWRNFVNKIGFHQTSSKVFWRRINRLKSKKEPNSIPDLIHGGKILKNDQEKANAFGEKLVDTFNETPNIGSNYNEVHKEYVDSYVKSKKFIKDYPNKTFSLITLQELEINIKKLNNKKSLDGNNISNIVLKKLPIEFKKIILDFFNKSITDGITPFISKQSTITMIPKRGLSSDIKNYRPISKTSCLIKLLEKIIQTRLLSYLNEKNIIIKQQSGFRKNRQTRDNLIFMTQKILEAFGNRKKACCIFFDIKSAFDKVWHNGLIFKLIKLKIPLYLISWIENFLTNRTFSVKIDTYETQKFNITCGVPQGTILSPLLFSIFINDLPLYKNKNSKYSLLFADDLAYLQIFSKINNAVENSLNKQISSLEKWLNNWRLTMAPEKCSYSIFSKNFKAGDSGKKGYDNENLQIRLYNQQIILNNNWFDKYLTFKNQISYIKTTCYNKLNILKVLVHKSWSIEVKTLLLLYRSLIGSIIDYSLFIFPILSNTNKRKIQHIQDSSLRLIFNKKYDYSSQLLHDEAEFETLEVRSIRMLKLYFSKGEINFNPLCSELIEGFEIFNHTFKNENIITLVDFI